MIGARLVEAVEEAKRWFKQSLRDLKASKDNLLNGNYEWSCFQAQQSAEKALKALLYAYGVSAWGHSVYELLDNARRVEEVSEDLRVMARELDRHYVPSRYPNAFESGYPGMYYDEPTATRAIRSAEVIVEWVRGKLMKLGVKP